jgi:UDP-N-acetylmuramoylalanine--D-glutamate ligase
VTDDQQNLVSGYPSPYGGTAAEAGNARASDPHGSPPRPSALDPRPSPASAPTPGVRRGTKILVVGLGKTGLSCARYLAARGERVAITDSRAAPPALDAVRAELPDVALFLGGFDPAVFASADLLVVSPGVPVATAEIQAAQQRGVPVIGDIELFARAVAGSDVPVAAITGSNGKSTVTTLLGEMARAAGRRVAVGGNLGEPALDLLADDRELYVLELSSFQLETTMSLQPAAATVLNVSPDHLDRYPDLAAYAAAKARILDGAAVAVLNADDPVVRAMPGGRQRWYFTLAEPQGPDWFGLRTDAAGSWLCRGAQPLLPATDLLIPGRHNLANALAALAMGQALALPLDAMLAALRGFRGLAHRTEFVAAADGIAWYNDSKGTNPGACIAALQGLHDDSQARTVLIAGGDGKGADFAALAPVVARCARAVVLLGRDAPQLARALRDTVPLVQVADLRAAVGSAAELAQPGDRVLLSPACASFDMFRNYEQRGEVFKAAVRELLA